MSSKPDLKELLKVAQSPTTARSVFDDVMLRIKELMSLDQD